VGNLILNIRRKLFNDDIIIVHVTQPIGVLFSTFFSMHNSELVINSVGTRKKTNKLDKLMLPV